MADEKEAISKLEYDLAEFLIDYQASHFADIRTFAYKYNNLKIYMNPTRIRRPHFFVKFGISEACFDIDSGNKLEGSLGPEDRMVQKWANRIGTHRELETFWKDLSLKSKLKKGEFRTKKSERDADIGKDNPVNISAIIRGQKKKVDTKKRQAEKWGKKEEKKDDNNK